MNNLAEALAPGKPSREEDTSGERDLLLAALRAASARARLAVNELDSIGTSLRHRAVTCAGALEWANEEGLLPWIRLGPEAQGAST
jgi:hypothetical protein